MIAASQKEIAPMLKIQKWWLGIFVDSLFYNANFLPKQSNQISPVNID